MVYVLSFFLFFVIVFPKLTLLHITNSGVGVRVEDIFVAIIGLLLVLRIVQKKDWRFLVSKRIFIVWWIFLFWSGSVTILGALTDTVLHTNVGIFHWGRYVQFFVVFLAAAHLKWDKTKLRTLLFSLYAAVGLVIVYGLLQRFDLVPYFSTLRSLEITDEISYRTTQAIMSTFAGHYDYGIFLVFSLAFPLVGIIRIWQHKTGWQRIVPVKIADTKLKRSILSASFVVFFGCAIYSIIATHARSAYIALLVMFLLVGVRYSKWIAGIAAAALGFLVYLFTTGRLSRLLGKIEIGGKIVMLDLSTVQRLNKWSHMLGGLSLLTFFIGEGLSSQGEALDGYYMRLLGEIGLLGLLIFASLIFSVMKVAYDKVTDKMGAFWIRMYAEAIFWGTLVLLAQAIFIDTFVSSKVMFAYWFMTGILIALDRCAQNSELSH